MILFVLTSWWWPATRKWGLLALVGVTLSWFGLGVFYGWGYCPLTDWHWQVLEKRGATGLPDSYIEYLLEVVTRVDWSVETADGLALLGLGFAWGAHGGVWRRGREGTSTAPSQRGGD